MPKYVIASSEIFPFEDEWIEEQGHDVIVTTGPGPVHTQVIGSIFNQPGWKFWMHHADPYSQPESRDAWQSLDPSRVEGGLKSAMWFSFYRRMDAGMQRTFDVVPGQRITFSAYMYMWSNGLTTTTGTLSDPHWSDGCGYETVDWLDSELPHNTGNEWEDAMGNGVLAVGIDPYGGLNALDGNVIWSPGRCKYNGFGNPISVTIVVPEDSYSITVFMRSTIRYAFKHNDVYCDTAKLVIESPAVLDGDLHHKLGPHVLNNSGGLTEYLHAGPSLAVFTGEWGLATECPEGTLVIGKVAHSSFDAQSLYKAGMSPQEAVEFWIGQDMDTYDSNPHIKYWIGPNEPVWTTLEEMSWYSDFEIERMRMMWSEFGLRCCIGEFATGTPPMHLWPAFLPALEEAVRREAVLGLHEYSCPWMSWMTGDHQLDPNEDQGAYGWTTLRYRKIHDEVLMPAGLTGLRIAITECGIDPMVRPLPQGMSEGGTWKELGSYWAGSGRMGGIAEIYYAELLWYSNELDQDDYVVGGAVFCWGNFGSPWEKFDVAGTDVAEKLCSDLIDYPAPDFQYVLGSVPAPDPDPVPVSGRGQPRIDYKRTYLLLPPLTSVEDAVSWWAAACLSAFKANWTVGGSADDAGIGDLSYRRVLAVNPELWGGDLQAFYAEWYPGVTYIPIIATSALEMQLKLEQHWDVTETVEHIWQRDPRWGAQNLGAPGGMETIGSDGCALCVMDTVLGREMGMAIDPPRLNMWLNVLGVFYNDDFLDWSKFADQFTDLRFVARATRSFTFAELEELQSDPLNVVVLAVNDNGHFVYLVDTDERGLIVSDPWYSEFPFRRQVSEVSGIRLFRLDSSSGTPPVPEVPPVGGASSIRGVHAAPITSPPEDQDFWLDQLERMEIKWFKDMSCNPEWAMKLRTFDIEPVVRLYKGQQFPGHLDEDHFRKAQALVDVGVTYFEIGNEPNLTGEWDHEYQDDVDWHTMLVTRSVAAGWMVDAKRIMAMGGKPAVYAMAPTERNGGQNPKYSSVEWLKILWNLLYEYSDGEIVDWVRDGKVWQAVHVSPFNLPFDHDPYASGVNDMCLGAFQVYRDIAQSILGVTPKMISTEGGMYSPEHLTDLGWEPYTEEHWAEQMPLMFDYIQAHYPFVIGMCPWILTDEGVHDERWLDNGWYYGKSPRSVVDSLRG